MSNQFSIASPCLNPQQQVELSKSVRNILVLERMLQWRLEMMACLNKTRQINYALIYSESCRVWQDYHPVVIDDSDVLMLMVYWVWSEGRAGWHTRCSGMALPPVPTWGPKCWQRCPPQWMQYKPYNRGRSAYPLSSWLVTTQVWLLQEVSLHRQTGQYCQPLVTLL